MHRFALAAALVAAAAAPPSQNGPAVPTAAQGSSGPPLVEGDGAYRTPPKAIADLVTAPPAPRVVFDPGGTWMMQVERPALPDLAFVGRRMLGLAGKRIDPASNAAFESTYASGIVLAKVDGSARRRVPTSDDVRIVDVGWSQTGKWLRAVTLGDGGCKLWIGQAGVPGSAQQRTTRLSTIFGMPEWMPNERELLCMLVPQGRGPEPPAPERPASPNVRETAGEETPLRTYQDLLTGAHDAKLFEHYATTQLAIVPADGGAPKNLGRPGAIVSAEPSPDGTRVLVERLVRPYSLSQPWWRFATKIEVWTLEGRVEHVVADLPLASEIPIGGVRTGPRDVHWKVGEGRTLVWAEALDGGDPERDVPHRDRWMTQDLEAGTGPRELLRVEHRAWDLVYLSDTSHAIAREYDRDRRWVRALRVDLGEGDAAAPVVLEDRSIRDRYADPGRVITERDTSGHSVAVARGEWIWRAGRGATPDGLLPFLARQNLATGSTEIVWRCSKGVYETVDELFDPGRSVRGDDDVAPLFVTRRESPQQPPNWFLNQRDGTRRKLTNFADPQPKLRGATQELLTYERADGVPLSATLHLPPGHEEGDVHPLLVWAYPVEYNDPATAGQVSASPWTFTTVRGSSHLALLLAGYAILDGATMPIVGDPETMNDTFVEQVVASAEAAIEAAVERGVADRDRVAIGGHSYGAFMTANLLAHSDLFRAGIARSGAYNRTLTPFGFQSERRTLWEAPEVYFAVSPFLHASKIDEPILLVHGESDANSGTYPMQSERLFAALQGTGGTARLVMLPREAHGYRGKESVLQVQAEMLDWLERHVRHP